MTYVCVSRRFNSHKKRDIIYYLFIIYFNTLISIQARFWIGDESTLFFLDFI